MADTLPIHDQILAAALETASFHGISRLSMADVAKASGFSRQTLYRHFPSKDALIEALVFDQGAALVAQVVEAAQPATDPTEALRSSLVAALSATRDHPLLNRLITTEPESLLPLLTATGGSIMELVRTAVESVSSQHILNHPDVDIDEATAYRFSDLVTRLMISYAASPSGEDPELVADGIAAILITGMLGASPNTATKSAITKTSATSIHTANPGASS